MCTGDAICDEDYGIHWAKGQASYEIVGGKHRSSGSGKQLGHQWKDKTHGGQAVLSEKVAVKDREKVCGTTKRVVLK